MRISSTFLPVILAIHCMHGHAQNSKNSASQDTPITAPDAGTKSPHLSSPDLYEGIVTDQTVTRNGRDFYQFFVASWRERPLADRYTVSIREQPSARFGSQIHIFHGTRRIFFSQIPPSREQVRNLSEQAVETAYFAVTEQAMQSLLFRDHDLARDEI